MTVRHYHKYSSATNKSSLSVFQLFCGVFFFFSSRRRHTRFKCDWSSDVCSSDLWSSRLPVWVAGNLLLQCEPGCTVSGNHLLAAIYKEAVNEEVEHAVAYDNRSHDVCPGCVCTR